MTKRFTDTLGGKAAIAGAAIGSAAVAAALLYANRRRELKKAEPQQLPPIPNGETPETD